ncbi:MAG: glycosyltransferase family 39 protein [Bacteroidetes bacterium]|nr:glycosyltransferase family 39 protein [Bacteroidota bacterium]
MKSFKENLIVWLLLIGLALLFHWRYINEFPAHIHAWVQADRYALAIGFTENNFDFFHPQTFDYGNHSFADSLHHEPSRITAVDFPMHDVIPALIMKAAGTQPPWCFRLYILLYSLVGLYFLFKLAKVVGNNYFNAILVMVLAATSPVFVYYQSGFLPSIPSLANGIIGLYFYLKFLTHQNRKSFYFSILFLTLAALSRLPFAILLLSVMGVEILKTYKTKKIEVWKFISIAIGLLAILGYFLYNKFLSYKYGSAFLNHPLPVKDIADIPDFIFTSIKNWGLQYFSWGHYAIFFVLLILTFVVWNKKKTPLSEASILLLFIFSGSLVYAFLMLQQFPNHDYYFLDTGFLPIIFWVALMLPKTPEIKRLLWRKLSCIAIVSLCVFMVVNAVKSQARRRSTGTWDKTNTMIKNYEGSEKFLDSLHISKQTKFLVTGVQATNIPFLLMHRKGFALLEYSLPDVITEATNWKYDFAFFHNDSLRDDVDKKFFPVTSQLTHWFFSGDYILAAKSTKKLSEITRRSDSKPIYSNAINFINDSANGWESEIIFDSKGKIGIIPPTQEYGVGVKITDPKILCGSGRKFIVNTTLFAENENAKDFLLVTACNQNGKNVFFKGYEISKALQVSKQPQNITAIYHLPQLTTNNPELVFFFWNRRKNTVCYKRMEVGLY